MTPTPLLELKNINHSFRMSSGQKVQVLRDINFSIQPGEAVAVLGPSGSGKSTCLRIIAGLLEPSHGKVLVGNEELQGANPLVSMVFQSFVLLPWLTVFENISVGLEPLRLSNEDVKEKVNRVLDLVGLEGFEEAYPRELSGGMKQRVGIARALVMERPLLCLDEPFSALDVLTAETLRKEMLNLWLSKKTTTSTLVLVTHNITEAVSIGKRILVMGTSPGHIRVSIKNDLPYPRDERSVGFKNLVETIHDIITEAIIPDTPEWVPPSLAGSSIETFPPVPVNETVGLLEFITGQGGRADSFSLAHTLGKDFGHILFMAKAAELLDFVDTPKNMIVMTELGRRFVAGDVNSRKDILHHALVQLKLCQMLEQKLRSSETLSLPYDQVLESVQEWLPNENSNVVLDTLIQWARYGELFGYNDNTKEIYLNVPEEVS